MTTGVPLGSDEPCPAGQPFAGGQRGVFVDQMQAGRRVAIMFGMSVEHDDLSGGQGSLAALAARKLKRPVKVTLTRQQMFSVTTHRASTIQRVRLAASQDGKLTAITHEVLSQSARMDEYAETAAVSTRVMYAAPNRLTTHRIVPLDLPMSSFATDFPALGLRYGTTGKPVPGYEVRLVDEDGKPAAPGEAGELHVAGPSSAALYWNNREKTRATFLGGWTRSGDKYHQDEDGYYVYAGRSDDMLKVSGIYVSPIEVESALIGHEAVLEAAVVGKEDEDKLVKPIAYIVLKPGYSADAALAEALKAHVKGCLAPYKYPRWFEFVAELPKTATGKIQRFKLRALNAQA